VNAIRSFLSFLLGVLSCGKLCLWLAERLVRWSARRLSNPEACERYEAEYLASLDEVSGHASKLLAALVYVVNVPWMRWTLREGQDRTQNDRRGLPDLVVRCGARVDRLPWSPFHTRMVLTFGICWILAGFEIMIAANIGAQLSAPDKLGLSPTAIGSLASVYLLGEVVGALVFGQLSDRLGRRRLCFVTLTIHFVGSMLTACVLGNGVFSLIFLYLTRFIAGVGIGGEYAAINSAISELIQARYRGRVSIAIAGTYWAGAAVAGAVQLPLLSGAINPNYDWRIAVLIGPLLAIFIVFLRRNVPESPRWQIIHGRGHDAEKSIEAIEQEVKRAGKILLAVDDNHAINIQPVARAGYLTLLRVLFQTYPARSILSATMMITQSFLYNAIFFTYATVLVSFFHVDENSITIYLIPFAIGNLLGPLILGSLFDKIGRRKMISRTYVISGILAIVAAFLFREGDFTATTQTLAWCVIFFFASAGGSAAYLTVSEIFPIEVRAKAIAVFFAIAQTVGSIGPLFYGWLIDPVNPDPSSLFVGYIVAALMMVIGGVVALALAVDAENKSLEEVAIPLSISRHEGLRVDDIAPA
jgi:MFS family permease